jgi:hypothetical protein
VVDNGAAAFTSLGSWTTLTGVGYASDIKWSAAGSGAASTWTFSGLTPGQYRLAATWTGSALNAVDAPFAILSDGRLLSTVRVNQQHAASTFTEGGAAWQSLGAFTISGSTLSVRLNSSTTGRVLADAIRLERVYSTSGGSLPTRAELATSIDVIALSGSTSDGGNEPIGQAPSNSQLTNGDREHSASESCDLTRSRRALELAWDNHQIGLDTLVPATIDEVFAAGGLDFDAMDFDVTLK